MIRKILYWVLGIIGALAAIIIVIGLLNPTYEDQVSVSIDAPVEKAFAIFQDSQYMRDWIPGYKSSEIIDGEELRVGSKYKLTFEEGSREFTMVETITDYIPDEKFGFDLDDDYGKFHVDVTFEEKDGKTKVTETMTGASKGIIGKAMMALMKGSIKNQKQEMYNDLASLVEGTEWSPPQPEPVSMDTVKADSIAADTTDKN
ncbi:MAG: SRPBCC family protein [Saprospiraceae bacterium]|nr:SRPBCC family protein [Saprospiraceae bacterium]